MQHPLTESRSFDAKAAVRSKEFSPASSLCEQSPDRFSVMRGRFAYVIGQRICAFAHVRVKRLSDSKRSGTAERISIHDVPCMMKAFVFDDRSGNGRVLEDEGFFTPLPDPSIARKKAPAADICWMEKMERGKKQ